MRITTIRPVYNAGNGSKKAENACPYEDPKNSPDWEYMHQCALRNCLKIKCNSSKTYLDWKLLTSSLT